MEEEANKSSRLLKFGFVTGCLALTLIAVALRRKSTMNDAVDNESGNFNSLEIKPLWVRAGSSQEELDTSWIIEPNNEFWKLEHDDHDLSQ